jgi:hypothetical protein
MVRSAWQTGHIRGRRYSLAAMMPAGLPVPNDAVDELAILVRAVGADDLADRLDQALADDVKLLALTVDERLVILNALEDPPPGLAELRGVLVSEHQWRQREGLD